MSFLSEQLEVAEIGLDDARDRIRVLESAMKDAIVNLKELWNANQPACPAGVEGVIEDLEMVVK